MCTAHSYRYSDEHIYMYACEREYRRTSSSSRALGRLSGFLSRHDARKLWKSVDLHAAVRKTVSIRGWKPWQTQ
jgi:hypothetical protein